MVPQGQMIAVLSNPELQLQRLARQTEVDPADQQHAQPGAGAEPDPPRQRARRILEAGPRHRHRAGANTRLRARRSRERGFVAGRPFADSRDTYEAYQRRAEVVRTQQATDERLQSGQLAQLRASIRSRSTRASKSRAPSLDALNLRAPVSGQLIGLLHPDRPVAAARRTARRRSIAPARNKFRAGVDEFYLGRVQVGQTATADVGRQDLPARVNKIYPQVRNSQFEIDLQFIGAEPQTIQRGQTAPGAADVRRSRAGADDPQRRLLQRYRRHLGVRRRA